jgi:hypothetical protein
LAGAAAAPRLFTRGEPFFVGHIIRRGDFHRLPDQLHSNTGVTKDFTVQVYHQGFAGTDGNDLSPLHRKITGKIPAAAVGVKQNSAQARQGSVAFEYNYIHKAVIGNGGNHGALVPAVAGSVSNVDAGINTAEILPVDAEDLLLFQYFLIKHRHKTPQGVDKVINKAAISKKLGPDS